jgi:predicted Zn finger-like uncharacterized protein
MALATQCPFCQTTFRVANDQLKLRDGLVRCGHCHEVFDGNAHLLADQAGGGNGNNSGHPGNQGNPGNHWPASPSSPLSSVSSSSSATPLLVTPAMARANAAAPHYGEPQLDSLPDADAMAEIEAAWDLPPPFTDDEFAVPADTNLAGTDADTLMIEEEEEDAPIARSSFWRTAAQSRQDQDHDDDDDGDGDHPDNHHDDIDFSAPLPVQPSSTPHDDRDAFSDAADFGNHDGEFDEADADASDDETLDQPEFILAAQRRQRRARARRVLMIVLSVVLFFTALMQGVYLERNRIALAAPQLKPLLVAACQPLRCTIGLQRKIDLLSIESNELQAATPDHPALGLNLLLRNRADMAMAWPDIELTLNNDDDEPLIRRVIAPAEYLPAGQTVEAGMAGDTEQPVKLSFTLAQGAASGYRVYLFYP